MSQNQWQLKNMRYIKDSMFHKKIQFLMKKVKRKRKKGDNETNETTTNPYSTRFSNTTRTHRITGLFHVSIISPEYKYTIATFPNT